MIYFIIGLAVLIVVILAIRSSRRRNEDSRQKEYHIYTYVVMEKEDEEVFDNADEKLIAFW